ncbi:MAG: fumarate reductase subunit FrdD [Polaromonas sp.]
MANSNKPIFWSLFAAGGTLAAILAPVLVLLFLLTALGFTPSLLGYDQLHAVGAHWLGKLFLLTVITLFLWHAAHRFRVTLHDFGLRQDPLVAIIVYLAAASGTALAVLYLWRI